MKDRIDAPLQQDSRFEQLAVQDLGLDPGDSSTIEE
jgi:hypothetical protein